MSFCRSSRRCIDQRQLVRQQLAIRAFESLTFLAAGFFIIDGGWLLEDSSFRDRGVG